MKNLRSTKRRSTRSSLNRTQRTMLSCQPQANPQQLAMDCLIEISNTAPLDISDPFQMNVTYQHCDLSPTFNKSAVTTQNNFPESHSNCIGGQKQRFLVRKKDMQGSPVRRKLERRINYIEYSPTKKNIIVGDIDGKQLKSSTVYVAKIKQEVGLGDVHRGKVKDSRNRWTIYQQIPNMTHSKVLNQLKAIRSSPKKQFHSASGHRSRGIFQLEPGQVHNEMSQRYSNFQRKDEDVDFMISRFKHMVMDNKLNVLNLRLTAPKSPTKF